MTFEDLCNAVRYALGGMRDRDGKSFVKFVGKLTHFANFRDMVKDHLVPKSQFQGITDFRLFRFRKIVIDGKITTEFMVKRSMHEKGDFYNFMCRRNTHQPIMNNNVPLGPQFFTDTQLWPSYIIPPMKDTDELRKYKLSIKECRARIERTVQCRERAQEIILELEGEIELMETGAEYAYDWNTLLYVTPTTYDIGVEVEPSAEEVRDLQEMLKTKAADRLYRLENGLALDLDELSVGNMVIVDHGEIDEHGFPFSVARVDHIFNKPSEEKFGQIRVCYHTVHYKRGQKKQKICNPSKLLNCAFVPDQVAAPSHNKHARKQSFVPYLDYIERENIILVFERLVNKGKLPEAIQNELKTLPHHCLQAVFGTVSQEEQDVEADSDSENSEYDSS